MTLLLTEPSSQRTTMIVWVFLILKLSMINSALPQFIHCPRERGIYFSTSPDCIFYYQCENRFLRTQVCFPWQRFDIHTLKCRRHTEVDCNPAYAGIWQPSFGDRPGMEEEENQENGFGVVGEPLGEVFGELASVEGIVNSELAGEVSSLGLGITEETNSAEQDQIGTAEESPIEGGVQEQMGTVLGSLVSLLKPQSEITGENKLKEISSGSTESDGESLMFGQRLPEENNISGQDEMVIKEGSKLQREVSGESQSPENIESAKLPTESSENMEKVEDSSVDLSQLPKVVLEQNYSEESISTRSDDGVKNGTVTALGSPNDEEIQKHSDVIGETFVSEVPAIVTEVKSQVGSKIDFEAEIPSIDISDLSLKDENLETQPTAVKKIIMTVEQHLFPDLIPQNVISTGKGMKLEKSEKLSTQMESDGERVSPGGGNLQENSRKTDKRSTDNCECKEDNDDSISFPESEYSQNTLNLNGNGDGNPSPINAENPIDENAEEFLPQNIISAQQLQDTEITPPGKIWYWCGSGRYVLAQNSQEGDSICLQLRDPEAINEESNVQLTTTNEDNWPGHTFLGTNNEFL